MGTVTYTLAPEPIWTLINTVGTVAGGGTLSTRSSQNPEVLKPVYLDPLGQEAWPNPIVFDLNGTAGPFYWQFDSANPTDLYYLQANDAQGNPLWNINYFTGIAGISGGGGGGTVTSFIPLHNYITNNQFIDH